jgi:arginyl-tRNA--protein-N-Asp/Glu arginylyltransferase
MLLGKLLIETSFSRVPNHVKRCAYSLSISILNASFELRRSSRRLSQRAVQLFMSMA